MTVDHGIPKADLRRFRPDQERQTLRLHLTDQCLKRYQNLKPRVMLKRITFVIWHNKSVRKVILVLVFGSRKIFGDLHSNTCIQVRREKPALNKTSAY